MTDNLTLQEVAIAAILSLVVETASAGMAASVDRNATKLEVIAQASLANRDSFDFFTCFFTVSYGHANDREQAVSRGPTHGRVEAEGIWVVNNEKVRYELNLSREVLESEPREVLREDEGAQIVLFGIRLAPSRKLWDGDLGLSYKHRRSAASVISPGGGRPGIQMTPFDMVGMMGPDEKNHPGNRILNGFNSSDLSSSFEGATEVDGKDLLAVDIQRTFATSKVRYRWLFDPARSFLPVRMTYVNSANTQTDVVVTSVKECSGGRWFPMRSVKTTSRAKGPGAGMLEAFEVKVTHLEVDTPPSENLFAIEIPAGTIVHNVSETNAGQVGVKTARKVGLGDLEFFQGLTAKAEEALKERRKEREAHAQQAVQPRTSPPWRIVLLVLNGVLIAGVLLVFLVFRKRKR